MQFARAAAVARARLKEHGGDFGEPWGEYPEGNAYRNLEEI